MHVTTVFEITMNEVIDVIESNYSYDKDKIKKINSLKRNELKHLMREKICHAIDTDEAIKSVIENCILDNTEGEN